MWGEQGKQGEGEDGAEQDLEAQEGPDAGAVTPPHGSDHALSGDDHLKGDELHADAEVEEQQQEERDDASGRAEEREAVTLREYGARQQEKKHRERHKDTAEQGEILRGGELPGSTEFEGPGEQKLVRARERGRKGVDGVERLHGTGLVRKDGARVR